MNQFKSQIAVIDDDVAVCDSLDLLFETRNWPVKTFSSAEQFLEEGRPELYSCLIVDVRMSGMSGLALFAHLRDDFAYVPPLIFLTGHGDVPMAVNAVKEGAADFLEKPCDHHKLLAKVEACLARDAEVRASRTHQDSVLTRLEELTPRERQVLREILAGKLNKQVADRLDISIKTVEVHRARIFTKMRVHSAMELAAMLKDIPLESWCPQS